MKLLSILHEMESDTKRSHKLSILEREKDNELFKRVLKLALDPYKQFYIRKIPPYLTSNEVKPIECAINGFTDSMRITITNDIDMLMGSIVEILYNERISSKNRNSSDSLFLPRFSRFRTDKTLANISVEIK